jgi:hypothetical protein
MSRISDDALALSRSSSVKFRCTAVASFALRAPPAATPPPHRRAWLRISVVQCGLPCDPPLGGHSCNGGIIPRFHRAVSLCDRPGQAARLDADSDLADAGRVQNRITWSCAVSFVVSLPRPTPAASSSRMLSSPPRASWQPRPHHHDRRVRKRSFQAK